MPTGPLSRRPPKPPPDPDLQQGLEGGRQFMANLHRTLHALRGRGQNNTPEFKQLTEIAGEVSDLVSQAWTALNQAHIAPPDAVARLIQAGKLQEAGQAVAEKAQNYIDLLRQNFADLAALRQLKPSTLPAGTNLAAPLVALAGAGAAAGRCPDFVAAHLAARMLTATKRLASSIDAGDDGAKAQLALLTAIVEYGDKLAAPIPDMRVRPPVDSPFLPVYDRVKRLLENFQYGGARISLLNPGRLSALMQTDRESSIRDVAMTLQAQPALKKDAAKIAADLRDAFETEMNEVFAATVPELGALRQAMAGLGAAEGVTLTAPMANLLLNPHLDPARCVADLAALIGQADPARGPEQCLAQALRLRERVNELHQRAIEDQAARLYRELDGNPTVFAVQTLAAGNMADALGLPLVAGNASGALDYVGLLNNGYAGRVTLDEQQRAFFTSGSDPAGILVYTNEATGEVGRGLQTALLIQPLKMDTARHFEHPPTVAITIPGDDEPAEQVLIEYHRQGRGFRPEPAGRPLPAGMSFDAARGELNLGPRFTGGQAYRVGLSVRSREQFGDWEDFVILLARVVAHEQTWVAADVFEPGRNRLRPGAAIVPDAQLQVLADWLCRGAGLEFTELVGAGVHPQPADHPAMNACQVVASRQLDAQSGRSAVRVAIRAFTDPRPCPAYQSLADHDPAGNVGLSQDRSVVAALSLLAALEQELASTGHEDLAAGLHELEDALQMKMILPPSVIAANKQL